MERDVRYSGDIRASTKLLLSSMALLLSVWTLRHDALV
jgi:hypothetical protein